MLQPVVAIIGRPNVGKSSLFNRLTGTKKAIVHSTSGVTRDRNYEKVSWNGSEFFLIDTGGYVPHSKDLFESAIREQVNISIEEADIILFVVDGKTGLTPLDEEIASIIRNNHLYKNKKIFLVVNKIDTNKDEESSNMFYKLGMGEPLRVSALSGRNSGDLLDQIIQGMKSRSPGEKNRDNIKISIIGRPNAGKSSINNILAGKEKSIVTDIPGTTRDSIDSVIQYHGKEIIIIDTAGLRKKSRIKQAESLEYYSVIRTYKSIERCDVAVLVIDATTIMSKLSRFRNLSLASFKLNREDTEIINLATDMKKGLLVVVNKWDLIQKSSDTARIFETKVKEHLKTYLWLPFLFTSVVKKQRIFKILDICLDIYSERNKKLKTSELNSTLLPVIRKYPPRSEKHREIKINYITQISNSPPVIVFYTNLPSEIQANYRKFLENKVREKFGFRGVPLTLVFRKK